MLHRVSGKSNNFDLIIDDDDRYSRLRLIGWWDQDRIKNAKVLVVGAGALGNEVLKNLALLGLGTIYLVDFDLIQNSNLSRSVLFREHHAGMPKAKVAAQMAMELNPDCQIIPIQGDVLTEIGLGLVREMDVVICCVDNREARLWINRMCWKANRPWIDGGIQEINGVAKVFQPPEGACYECAMTENDYRLIALRYSCPLLRQEDLQLGKVPTAPTIASIIGGLQVQEALKLLHELPTATGVALVFNGAANNFYKTNYPRREACLSHETYDPIESLPLGSENTIGELFEMIASRYSVASDSLTLILDRDFLIELKGRQDGSTKQIERPLSQVSSREGICEISGEPLLPNTICSISFESPYVNRTLRSIGIPVFDIVKIASPTETYFIELTKDKSKIESWGA
jgi:molybdopterin/thiamine biosynthesis adenylyltransferase